jgi:cell division protein FtsX
MVLLQEELANLPETEHVQVDTEWVQRLHAILDIENRREEIEVTKLIGASNAFVRRPFLWTGFWYGLFGPRSQKTPVAWWMTSSRSNSACLGMAGIVQILEYLFKIG